MHSLFFIIAVFSCFPLMAQKNFKAVIELPHDIELSKLSIRFDDGKKEVNIKDQILKGSSGPYVVQGSYYSKYAALIFDYQLNENMRERKVFFIGDKPAEVRFLKSDSPESILGRYSLENADDFEIFKHRLDKYITDQASAAKRFYSIYGAKIFDGSDPKLEDTFFSLDRQTYLKAIEFIQHEPESYYNFWYFRRNAHYSGLPVDTLLQIFDTAFSPEIRSTYEGVEYRKLLVGKLQIRKGNKAPQFSSKDVEGAKVSLSDYLHKKFVILDFWATWCLPCIQEMKTLRHIQSKYGQLVEIISIAYPTSLPDVRKAISDQGMNWWNIYDDDDLITAYGGKMSLPRVYLINPSGEIIYSRIEDGDPELEKLVQLLDMIDSLRDRE